MKLENNHTLSPFLLKIPQTFSLYSKGLKVALVHHLDMPIMRQTGFHISPGTENQIAITPTLLATTQVSFDLKLLHIGTIVCK